MIAGSLRIQRTGLGVFAAVVLMVGACLLPGDGVSAAGENESAAAPGAVIAAPAQATGGDDDADDGGEPEAEVSGALQPEIPAEMSADGDEDALDDDTEMPESGEADAAEPAESDTPDATEFRDAADADTDTADAGETAAREADPDPDPEAAEECPPQTDHEETPEEESLYGILPDTVDLPRCMDIPDLRSSLATGVQAMTAMIPELRVGILAEEQKSRKVIVADNAEDVFVPASNAKLVTSAAALTYLGPEYRFVTEFYVPKGGCRNGGDIKGPLYIRGGGDPSLVYEQVWRIARVLRQKGMRSVRGITIDESLFPGTEVPGADFENNERAYRAPVGALSVSFNAFEIYIRPGPSAGTPAVVSVEPALKDFFTITNNLKTSRRSNRLRIDVRQRRNGTVNVRVWGRINRRAGTYVYSRRVASPWKYAGAVFKHMLEEAGIRVRGRVRLGSIPSSATDVYTHRSDPLWKLVGTFNKHSNNFMTEMVLLSTTAEVSGAPATWEKAQAMLTGFLEDLGLNNPDVVMENGSGLTVNTRLSPKVLVGLVQDISSRRYLAPEFLSSLAIGARDGTLRSRLSGLPDVSLVRAKTGTLEDALGLSGLMDTSTGASLVFSILVNGCPKSERSQCVDMIDWLVSLLDHVRPSDHGCMSGDTGDKNHKDTKILDKTPPLTKNAKITTETRQDQGGNP